VSLIVVLSAIFCALAYMFGHRAGRFAERRELSHRLFGERSDDR
jgi:hypothetical protein